MTISEYMESIKKLDNKCVGEREFSEIMSEQTDIWSNDSCRGYFIMSALACGIDSETIREMLTEMKYAFSDKSVSQAEQFYINW